MRRFVALFAFLLAAAIASAQAPQAILDSTTIPQFETPLPTLSVLPQSGNRAPNARHR